MHPIAFHLGSLPIRWYGVMMALAFLAGLWTATRRARIANVAGDVRQPGAARGRPQPGEKRQRHHHAIPADGQGTEIKSNRMHGGKLERGGGNGNLKLRLI